MSDQGREARAAFHELIDLVGDADTLFLEGDRAVVGEIEVAEGYLWLTQLLHVACQVYIWADAARPTIVPITSPTLKWGGDNSDAFYHYAPIDPDRTYRLRGRRGDAAYLSITVYGGPDDGRWSTRIVDTYNDQKLHVTDDGSFELVLSREEPPDASDWLRLEPDAVALVTRDYLVDPTKGRSTEWSISTDDPAPPPRHTDADVARRFRAATNFLRDLFAVFPIALDPANANTIDEPYPVPQATYGWAAGDAAYAMGSFDLAPGEALVIEGSSPPCVFWNLCLWNPYLQTYDYRYEPVTVNGGQIDADADGRWQVVVAAEDPGVGCWLSTAGHRRGLLWFRWFLPEEMPARPSTEVVALSSLR